MPPRWPTTAVASGPSIAEGGSPGRRPASGSRTDVPGFVVLREAVTETLTTSLPAAPGGQSVAVGAELSVPNCPC